MLNFAHRYQQLEELVQRPGEWYYRQYIPILGLLTRPADDVYITGITFTLTNVMTRRKKWQTTTMVARPVDSTIDARRWSQQNKVELDYYYIRLRH